jgi:hypothetical protein
MPSSSASVNEHPLTDGVYLAADGQPVLMEAKTRTNARHGSSTDRARHNGEQQRLQRQQEAVEPGIDVPVLGHVEYKSVGFMAGLGIAGVVGVLEWPVAAAIAIGYALSRRE